MKILLVAGLALGLASGSGAAVKVGYRSIPGVAKYHENNLTTSKQINASESFGSGVFAVGGSLENRIGDAFTIGMEVSGGAPMGSFELDNTKFASNIPVGAVNPYTGDTTTIMMAPLALMARAGWAMSAGPGTLGVGLGAGAVLLGVLQERVEQAWDNPIAGISNDKQEVDAKAQDKTTTRESVVVPLFAVVVAPSYSVEVSEGWNLGLEIPLSLLSKTMVGYTETDRNPVDPDIENPAVNGWEIGGFGWGVNLVLSRKII